MLQIIGIIIGIPFITFIPGFFLSYAFFNKNDLTLGTRILLSFILTITSLPLLVYLASLLGMKLVFVNILIVACIIITFSGIFILIRKKIHHER